MKSSLCYVFAIIILLTGCSGDNNKTTISKEGRISVLQFEQTLRPDLKPGEQTVALPTPVSNAAWLGSGGNPNHINGHLALGTSVKKIWRTSLSNSGEQAAPLPQPIIIGDRLFVVDASAILYSINKEDGEVSWKVALLPDAPETPTLLGGLAFSDNAVLATVGTAELIAVRPDNGAVLWRASLPAPARSAPTVLKGQAYVTTNDNELIAFNTRTGVKAWSHIGLTGGAILLGSASPAATDDIVVTAYSSGEIVALRPENGRPLWGFSLAGINRTDPIAAIADIIAHPLINDQTVIALGNAGRMVALNTKTGAPIWERDIGGTETPWLVGNYLYVVSNDNRLICMRLNDGKIVWITNLAKYEDPEDKETPILWSSPIVAGDRLLIAGTHRKLLSVSPYTGAILGEVTSSDVVLTPPLVVGQTLYVLSQDAVLTAYR
ncbi:MAG: PQQ-binding-like beta-propeller repeat protein [Holosporales bacterium]|jgi:outer membrane protein assembly factor BamB